jgi:hypothetical protein
MRSFFDPRHAMFGGFYGGSNVEERWLQSWKEATRWWADLGRSSQDASPPSGPLLLAEIVEGLASRFEGRQIECTVGGRRLRARVDWIRLRQRGAQYEARLDLLDVEYAGWRIAGLSAIVRDIAVDAVPAARLIARDIEIRGRTGTAEVMGWVNTLRTPWVFSLESPETVRASARRSSFTAVVEPEVVEHRLNLEVRALRLGRVSVRVPAWFRVTRCSPLPALPREVFIREARPRAGLVEFRLTLPELSERLDLRRLRSTILAGRATGAADVD